MSSVAEDLLNDFGSSGDEAEEEQNDGLVKDEESGADRDAMDIDGGAGPQGAPANGDGDEEMDDDEATKARVEKMQLGGVKDVRSVASLMATLEPILEVSFVFVLLPYLSHNARIWTARLHLYFLQETALTYWCPLSAENHTLPVTTGHQGHRQHRRPPRVQDPYAVQRPLDANRRRGLARAQIHPRPLLDAVPGAREARYYAARVRQGRFHHRQWTHGFGEHQGASDIDG